MLKTKIINNKAESLVYPLAIILMTLPLKNIFVSISTILFLFITFFNIKKGRIIIKKEFFIPISLFILMMFSLLWTVDFENSLFGLQKALPFLVIPLAFFVLPQFSRRSLNTIFKTFSVAMVLYALFYLATAVVGYVDTKNSNLFFSNNMVPIDPGAVYMSVFASFALFYYIQHSNKNNLEKIGLTILTIFIFLLSSKSIITIDFLIIIFYYAFFAQVPKSTKVLTILSVSVFLFFSIFYVKGIRERFLVEYETAFVDNTLYSSIDTTGLIIHNVSLEQAWESKKFQKNDYFPGTALRVYQTRIFLEMQKEENIFFNGFGLEASQKHIRQKAKEHNLYSDYGEYNFHNQYIQIFSELGFFGFLILLLLLFINIRNAFKNKDFLHIAFSITMIILFLSESFFCRQRGIIFFIVLYCLFNSIPKSKKEI